MRRSRPVSIHRVPDLDCTPGGKVTDSADFFVDIVDVSYMYMRFVKY